MPSEGTSRVLAQSTVPKSGALRVGARQDHSDLISVEPRNLRLRAYGKAAKAAAIEVPSLWNSQLPFNFSPDGAL